MKNKIAKFVFFVGTFLLLSSILTIASTDIPAGEPDHGLFWMGRFSIVFVVFTLLSLWLAGKRRVLSFPLAVSGSLILLAGIEALWGVGQIYGLLPSSNARFVLTGSFYNPGPYSGYLAMVFPLCLHEWMRWRKMPVRTLWHRLVTCFPLWVLLLILCVLPAGMSRSAWIAAVVSGVWVYAMEKSWHEKVKGVLGRCQKRKAWGGIVLLIVLFTMAGIALFQLKAGSASGRLLMWKISCRAIAEKPLGGHGAGRFVWAYGEAQERYFAKGHFSATEEWVAGSPEYAFNEYLQVAVEYGIPLLVLALFVVGYCLRQGIKRRRVGLCGAVVSLLIFSFSSYPLQFPAFALTFGLLLAACIVGRSRYWLLCLAVCVASLGFWCMKSNRYEACREWTKARLSYGMGAYGSAKNAYEQLYPQLRDRGTFLFEYGHCLHKLREYERSNQILEKAMVHSCDPMLLNIIGKNYQALGKYPQAEACFVRSTHRLPGRIYPYYLLAKLYAEPAYRHPEKLKQAVETVFTKTPKVPSTAIREMREEVKRLK
ncbi:MAG: O-antigen ligase family protein [Mediterranea sp.]|jgi:O-antigen ligase|nr:O-antigen ligase family protein [Mediterranea sp.]